MSKLLEAMRAMKASDSTDEEVNEVSYNELHPVYYQIKNKLVYSATRSKVSVRQMSEAVAYLAEVMHCVKQWKKIMVRLHVLSRKLHNGGEQNPTTESVAGQQVAS